MAPEVLKPACIVYTPGIKATKHVSFLSQKSIFVQTPPSVLEAMETTRAKLLCECKDFSKPTQYQWEQAKAQFQWEAYMENATQYLSLLQGYFAPKETPPPPSEEATEEDQSKKKLLKSTQTTTPISFASCEWLDVAAKSAVHSLNAFHEYAHTMYAIVCILFQRASDLANIMLSTRDFDFDEPKLKEAYQILLRASGICDSTLGFLGYTRQAPTTTNTSSNDAAMEAWRAEQAQADTASQFAKELSRVKDFEGGIILTAMRSIALAQAQELVVLRGVTRETVDWVLMGKLCSDIAKRYKGMSFSLTWVLIFKILPPNQPRLRAWCDFKSIYYSALSPYYQGVAEWNKNDAAGCVQAIAQYQQAKEELAKLQTFAAETQRSREIIQRDLDIAAARNSSIYFESIPTPLPELPPTSLVQIQTFSTPVVNTLWKEPVPVNTTASAPPRGSPALKQPDPGCGCTIM
ncbi:hypothetical protein THRCLA_02796 [Thraustotheca clavata]|uniref:BRO1 domain-containing protein n=1 Tax=Thraustotheca clavata TaxID=74557 RepID=A0A1W0A4B0_9STRA|nr:hypothetical protein THRCLA_02796 [Thraustotheca clavata]